MSSIHEYEYEMVAGIPGVLPKGERVLWQGHPRWVSFMLHVLHAGWISAYFGALMAWRFAAEVVDGQGMYAAFVSALWIGVLWSVIMAILSAFAWASVRNTIYTITTKRVVYRYGVAFQMAVNVPFNKVDGAGLKTFADGTGELTLTIGEGDRLAYLMLWPNVRRWHFMSPQPMFRSIPDATGVAKILSDALAATQAEGAVTVATEAPRAKPVQRPLKPLTTSVATA